ISRWHGPGCQIPNIFVDNSTSTPSCRTCGRAPNLADMVDEQASLSSYPKPPPDELAGEMNLWWPPTVKYVNFPELEPLTRPEQNVGTASQAANKEPCDSNPVYSVPLSENYIRLAVLTRSADSSFPVHLELETYSLENHPEYETASYNWGGENNDNTRCHPIYIGPYWDVVLQAQNCWNMLRFLRLNRGLRLVWVDAICINQFDNTERAEQVSFMGRIYRQGFQVVVHLGDDIAPVLEKKRWPQRELFLHLDSLEFGGTAIMLRRYFTRLWVIQELVLSSRVVIRVGDVDYWTDCSGFLWLQLNRYNSEGELDIKALHSSWKSYMATGNHFWHDLSDLLRLTRNMACADPRDRVFGLVGLISPSEQTFDPDYSLSTRHIFTGFFAHLLTEAKRHHLLAYAAGLYDGCREMELSSQPT
ncbi:heterokaryon incompatibility protein-domain-containing protein, partial [Podospora fimiseda]